MQGKLSNHQCEHLLTSEVVGRLGCYAAHKVYVVPVTYVFEGGYIYAHAKEGLKISMMRDNPNVCLQVDKIDSMTNWRSVVAWGKYEELKNGKGQTEALKILKERLSPLLTSESVKPTPIDQDAKIIERELRAVIYRIKIDEMTGRFEKSSI